MNNSSVCKTNGGIKPNTPCVFPFNYMGVVYNACIGIGHSTFWCSTKVDEDGNHVDGNWGNCGPACPPGKNLNSWQLFGHRMKIITKVKQNYLKLPTISNFLSIGCTCAGISNKYGEGSECKLYSEYDKDWYNGVWCYSDVANCPDAEANRVLSEPELSGYGASRAACVKGKYM